MRSFILCEKPSQAANIRAGIGDAYGPILPASGHLYALAEPDAYGAEWENWHSFAVYRPDTWLKVPTPGSSKSDTERLDKARSAITAALRGADRVYIATDADREGEVIGRELLEQNKYTGEAYRVLFTSEDPAAIKAAFADPIPLADRDPIYRAGLARERADFVWNFSLTRAATAGLLTRDAASAIGIGRVKSPTLGLVCRREIAVTQWQPSADHLIRITCQTPAGAVHLSTAADHTYPDKEAAEAAIATNRGQALAIKTTTTKKRAAPPKPPDLTALQVAASKWGWTAEKTLEIGQSLYSAHKVITYIRASTRAYPASLADEVPRILAGLKAISIQATALDGEPVIRAGKGGIFSDAALAGESHHAIAPNYRTAGTFAETLPKLSADERRLFELICAMFIEAVSPDYEYEATTLSATFDGRPVAGNVTRPLVPGWRAIRTDTSADPADDMTAELSEPLKDGDYTPTDYLARPTKSKPPQRYTHGMLISAMATAWQHVPPGERRDRLKEAKGIGTVATRDQIVKGLLEQQQLTEAKKAIVPTNGGLDLFMLLYRLDPRLVDPATTAEWELKFDEIARGTLALDAFLDEIAAETGAIIEKIRAQGQKIVFGRTKPPTPAMIKAIETIQRKKRIIAPAGWRTSYSVASDFLQANANRQGRER